MKVDLTDRRKKDTLNSAMGKRITRGLLLVALACLFSSCASSPGNKQIRFGVWATRQNLWDEAVFRWKKALETEPKSYAAHNNLAVAYEKKGLFDEALKEYEIALQLAPNNSYVKSNYQNCKEILKTPDSAAGTKGPDEKKKK
jgi:tetratricopeptide (TPR) repeat protein